MPLKKNGGQQGVESSNLQITSCQKMIRVAVGVCRRELLDQNTDSYSDSEVGVATTSDQQTEK